jgi:hypothetical protein
MGSTMAKRFRTKARKVKKSSNKSPRTFGRAEKGAKNKSKRQNERGSKDDDGGESLKVRKRKAGEKGSDGGREGLQPGGIRGIGGRGGRTTGGGVDPVEMSDDEHEESSLQYFGNGNEQREPAEGGKEEFEEAV